MMENLDAFEELSDSKPTNLRTDVRLNLVVKATQCGGVVASLSTVSRVGITQRNGGRPGGGMFEADFAIEYWSGSGPYPSSTKNARVNLRILRAHTLISLVFCWEDIWLGWMRHRFGQILTYSSSM